MVRRKADIKEYYVDVFEGVGCFPGPPYHTQLDPKVPPKQTPVRPVPVHLKEAFKQELKYYDPKKPTVLQTDASIKGLGACLLQCGHPVYFGSKALTDSQKGYVAIELEALAVSWAMEKFHHFLYATKFVLETDQKPLETILAKSLNAATPRLQRILIKTFAYDFTVKYLPGEHNQLADCLSRLGCLQDKNQAPKTEGASSDCSSQCNK